MQKHLSKWMLYPHAFDSKERLLVDAGTLKATLWRYDSNVCALKLQNALGHVICLPFQGQQIWSAHFLGRELTMKSMFDAPRATSNYLETYGAFLIHCGMTAMGVPGPHDHHPLHGELPNAPFQEAFVVMAEDDRGRYLALGGSYRHIVAFSHHYVARPLLKVYEGSSLLDLSLNIENLKATDMELMYLAHINFRPADHGELIYSAHKDKDSVRVRQSIPSHVTPKAGYKEFIDHLAQYPEEHHHLKPGLAFDPEIVFNINYSQDHEGWAHSLQKHPNGSYDYIGHRPAQLDVGVRWICRTPDQDALGLVLPATAEAEGYQAEKSQGQPKNLARQAHLAL
ncbi:MAG: DUF4432 family protein [Deinococcales bacterium]